jgi:DNA polymerase III delta prime subunit
MAENLAKLVTKENVLKALEKINPDDPNLHSSTKFDIVYKGKLYPPKEVVREAARIQGIENWWKQDLYRLNGGDSVNRHLKAKGFDIQPKAAGTRYYIGGSNWDGEDKMQEFFDGGYWKNGYADQFVDEVKAVPIGSFIAIKSTWADPKTRQDYLRIKGMGHVINNPEDGSTLKVKWQLPFQHFDIPGLSGYRKTFYEIINEEHIEKIFNHDEADDFSPVPQTNKLKPALNKILYGPPGTGKTYTTIDKALELVDSNFYSANKLNRTALTDRFRQLLISDWENTSGRIAFITFHQSLSYEDFIEGIKPLPPQNNAPIQYDVVDGIFKRLCTEATRREDFIVDVDGNSISLTPERFEEFYFAFSTSLPSYSTATSDVVLNTKEGYKFELFKSSVNSIVVKAGVQKTNTFISLNELKAVLFENKKPIYPSYEHIVLDKILDGRNFKKSAVDNTTKNYVLIIDEINRGNVSQIFGELITLIEDTKRQGSVEELAVQLPYSKKPFSVPPNLYIIGTMNTADRSVEALDTALRRRFTFEFVPPDSTLLEGKIVGGIDLRALLDKINARVAYLLDEDQRIGHSYFLPVDSEEKLAEVFSKSIIPLLKEYFYNDYGKIRMVLGEGLVTKKGSTDAKPKFAVKDENFIMDRPVYTIVEPTPDTIIEALTKTMTDA